MLAGHPDQRGGVEVALRVVDLEHERRARRADQQIAHDQGTGAMVALDEQLRLAQHADVDTRGLFPGVVAFVALVPFRDVANAATWRLVEVGLGRLDMPMEPSPLVRGMPAQYALV